MIHLGPIDIRTDVFVLLLSIVIISLQLVICFKIRNRMIRFSPIALFSTLTAVFFILTFTFDGWDSLGFLLLALCSALQVSICGLGWAIWIITKRIKKKTKT